MYIQRVPNRNSPPAILLRESYRENGKVRKRTLANLSSWPPSMVEKFQALLRGEVVAVGKLKEAFDIVRSRPHGHVVAVLGTLRRLKLESIIAALRSRNRDLVVAMVVARMIDPSSKLATVRSLDVQTSLSTLGELLGVEGAKSDELYSAMDWLLNRQAFIEQKLAQRHLVDGAFQMREWVEISSDSYPNERLIACRNPQLASERAHKREELLQATEQELEKIVVATQRCRQRLSGASAIGLRVGKVLHRFQMASHFVLRITEHSFEYERNQNAITTEAALDGIYVVRTNVEATTLSAADTVRTYKSLSHVERAFRSFKENGTDLSRETAGTKTW